MGVYDFVFRVFPTRPLSLSEPWVARPSLASPERGGVALFGPRSAVVVVVVVAAFEDVAVAVASGKTVDGERIRLLAVAAGFGPVAAPSVAASEGGWTGGSGGWLCPCGWVGMPGGWARAAAVCFASFPSFLLSL
eukprot:02084_1